MSLQTKKPLTDVGFEKAKENLVKKQLATREKTTFSNEEQIFAVLGDIMQIIQESYFIPGDQKRELAVGSLVDFLKERKVLSETVPETELFDFFLEGQNLLSGVVGTIKKGIKIAKQIPKMVSPAIKSGKFCC